MRNSWDSKNTKSGYRGDFFAHHLVHLRKRERRGKWTGLSDFRHASTLAICHMWGISYAWRSWCKFRTYFELRETEAPLTAGGSWGIRVNKTWYCKYCGFLHKFNVGLFKNRSLPRRRDLTTATSAVHILQTYSPSKTGFPHGPAVNLPTHLHPEAPLSSTSMNDYVQSLLEGKIVSWPL